MPATREMQLKKLNLGSGKWFVQTPTYYVWKKGHVWQNKFRNPTNKNSETPTNQSFQATSLRLRTTRLHAASRGVLLRPRLEPKRIDQKRPVYTCSLDVVIFPQPNSGARANCSLALQEAQLIYNGFLTVVINIYKGARVYKIRFLANQNQINFWEAKILIAPGKFRLAQADGANIVHSQYLGTKFHLRETL